jgi:hypothetical protein
MIYEKLSLLGNNSMKSTESHPRVLRKISPQASRSKVSEATSISKYSPLDSTKPA